MSYKASTIYEEAVCRQDVTIKSIKLSKKLVPERRSALKTLRYVDQPRYAFHPKNGNINYASSSRAMTHMRSHLYGQRGTYIGVNDEIRTHAGIAQRLLPTRILDSEKHQSSL